MKAKFFFTVSFLVLSIFLILSCSDEGSASDTNGTPTAVGTPIGASNSASIGAAGGSLSSIDGRLELLIPANALSSPTTITIQPITNKTPGGIGLAYLLAPDGQQFNQPITLRFHYDSINLLGTNYSALGIAYQEIDNIWYSFADISLDPVNSTVSITTNHFTDFSLYANLYVVPFEDEVEVSASASVKVVWVERAEPIQGVGGDELFPLNILQDYEAPSQVTWTLNGSLPGNQNDGTINPKINSITTTYTAPGTTTNMSSNPVAITARVDVPGSGVFNISSNIKVKGGAAYHCNVDYKATNAQIVYCIEVSYTDHGSFDMTIDNGDNVVFTNITNSAATLDSVMGFATCICTPLNVGDQLHLISVAGAYTGGLVNITLGNASSTPDFSVACESEPFPQPSIGATYQIPIPIFSFNSTGTTVVTYGEGSAEIYTLTFTPL